MSQNHCNTTTNTRAFNRDHASNLISVNPAETLENCVDVLSWLRLAIPSLADVGVNDSIGSGFDCILRAVENALRYEVSHVISDTEEVRK